MYVTEEFHEWYSIWQKSKYKPHTFDCYSVHLKKFLYNNGSCLNQIEPVLPEVRMMGVRHRQHRLSTVGKRHVPTCTTTGSIKLYDTPNCVPTRSRKPAASQDGHATHISFFPAKNNLPINTITQETTCMFIQ
jgi:hypothetical protein